MHATKRVSWQSKSVIVPTCSQGTAGAVQREGAEGGCAHRGVDAERVEAGQVSGGPEGEGDRIRHLLGLGFTYGDRIRHLRA